MDCLHEATELTKPNEFATILHELGVWPGWEIKTSNQTRMQEQRTNQSLHKDTSAHRKSLWSTTQVTQIGRPSALLPVLDGQLRT